ncbi:MAG TPA: zinc-binding dehydrogenase [Acidimicrobiales bacterium]|nr:zinc-binding dehydrogenase [Acidimicrobiales bacterium]
MRAAVLNKGKILVRDDVDEPKPGMGQALVEVKACGICGSDLHFAKHGASMMALGKEMSGSMMSDAGAGNELDLDQDVYMGHEFAAEVLDFGPDTQSDIKPGTLVTALPVLMGMEGVEPIVYSNKTKGGYGERMLLTAPLLLEVPNGLRAEHAALTEPMAVGLHGVNKGNLQPGEGALVLGCGPVGLACIAALKVKGVGPIVAADFSPARRQLAITMGAHEAVDPREETAWAAWNRAGNGRPPVVFEAIGVPGIINDIMKMAPSGARVVVVGVCMENDTINPFFGISKELNIQFALGYDPMEFAGSLKSIAEGEIDVAPMVTAEVPLDEVAWAFDALGNPEEHCKIVVKPS